MVNNSNNSNNASCPLVPQAESNEVPTLGGGGRNSCVGTTSSLEEEEYQSPLERLITQSTAEQRGDDFNFNFNHNIPSSSQLLWDDDDVNNNVNNDYNDNNNGRMISPSMEQTLLLGPSKKTSSSLVTLMACICCLLQICFIWASFLSSSWLDTRLIVSIYNNNNDNNNNNNNNNGSSSQLLHSTTLGSLLSSLLGTNRHWTAIALVFTSLILPCLCAISGIMAIIDDRIEQNNMFVDANNNNNNTRSLYYVTRRRLNKRRNDNNNNQSNNTNYYPRIFLEYIARIGFSIFFILLILDIGTSSSIEIEFNNTSFVFINQIQGGMVVYALGILCTLLVITLLRLGRTTKSHLLKFDNTDAAITNNNNNTQCTTFNNNDLLYHEQQEYFRKRRRNKQQSQDFQYSWQVSSNELFAGSNNEQEEDGNDNMELQTPLLLNHDEHEHNNNNNNNILGAGGDTNFLFISEAAEEEDMFDHDISQYLTGTMPTETSNLTSVSVLPFWKRAMLYELIVLSILLWLPTLFLPLFRLQYDGIMSDFMSDVSFSVKLWNFPVLLWERGISAGTNRGMLIIIESIVLLLVFICPILANILAICTWVSDTHTSKTYCKNLLWMIQPFLGSIVFGITIYLSIPAFEAVFEYVTDTYSYGLCKKFEIFTTDTCLTIQAQPSMGLYFLLGQALVLEIFVLVTLTW